MSTESEGGTPGAGVTPPNPDAESARPAAPPYTSAPHSAAVPPPTGKEVKGPPAEGDAPAPAPVREPSLARRSLKWATEHRLTAGLATIFSGVTVAVVAAVLIAYLVPPPQQSDTSASGGKSSTAPAALAHDFTIKVQYGSPIDPPDAMALPASAGNQLPNTVPDWAEDPPGPVTQAILARGPAEIGKNTFLVTMQNPAGQDSVDVEDITAKILQTSAPYSGALFYFPSQGSGPVPEVALDLDAADPDVRTWDPTSHMLGQNYFLDGNYIDVGGGDSQSMEVTTFASRAEYTYDLQVTLMQDGRTWTDVLTSDNHGTPLRITGTAGSYTVVYSDQQFDNSASASTGLTREPWTTCLCPPGTEPFSINGAASQ